MRDSDFATLKRMHGPRYNLVTTTLATQPQAAKLAGAIVRARLAACVQFWPIRSVYRWKGKLESTREYLLLCKTCSSQVGPLQTYIQDNHPYEIPEIVVSPLIGGASAYLSWVREETTPRPLTFRAPATRKRTSRIGRKS